MAEAILQGVAPRTAAERRAAAARAVRFGAAAVARGLGVAFQAVSKVISVTAPMAQGAFSGTGNVGPAMRGPGNV